MANSQPRSTWTLSKAKDRLSELARMVDTAGPQRIERRGAATLVVLTEDEYARLKTPGRPKDIKEWLDAAPKVLDGDFVFERKKGGHREPPFS